MRSMGCREVVRLGEVPSREDLLTVGAFAEQFDAPGFTVGEWVQPRVRDDGVTETGWWSASDTVIAWEAALYEHHIIDPDSDYMSGANIAFVNKAIADPSLLARVRLPRLRRVLTFLARAERHSGEGWYESAFESGMAQAATRRLRELGARGSE
jgi:hypothetical protein